MSMNILLRTAIPVFVLPFALSGHAAESAAAAAPTGQGTVAAEHAGHSLAATGGRAGMNKPMVWTRYPALKLRMSGENRESRVITVVPQNIVASSIEAFSNNLQDKDAYRQLALEMAGARLKAPASGGFQWLTAREEQGDRVSIASMVYYSAEHGGVNPTDMFMRQKHELEIIPQPYPREHSRYRAKEEWKFLVRFNSQPLIGQKVFLETSNGSKVELQSDAQGIVSVPIPDDFKSVEKTSKADAHSHGRRSADFVLAAEHVGGGKTYLTAFNGSYGPDAFDQRNLGLGLGFMLVGGLCAVPFIRQRKPATIEPVKNKDARHV